ncbi:subclass B3 metallo-beta-lactamase [Sphingomicrobium astaxanthinifaciens]|uniref:subclass B3 metallo-beta-lactamase n=1 Tax=Sphingomicrobium astaxanthinifaciens TaxID=1227949 RepID=UPI001FCB3774|nr:subclass B3 metallo-beta-lactamase [Sphingomicrobium astaxanthinifaciens]MCJ7421503.1 subclass B3 metallo-beta-lactamase [Sphingomicrobium astaxanthinifaciens]
MSAKRPFLLAALPALLAGCAIDLGPALTSETPPRPFEPAAYAAACTDWDDWDKPAPPVHVHGNSYLVGTCGVSAVLITSAEGHMLIDGGTAAAADLIAENIRTLGFSLRHVYWMSHSHEHHDHVGGLAKLKAMTQARMVSGEAARWLEAGQLAPEDPQAGMHERYAPIAVDDLLVDGEEVGLGGLRVRMLETPGHSPGALSWTWEDCGPQACHRIAYVDSLSPVSSETYRFTDHPAYLDAFRASLDRIEALDCDILLTPHPSASNMIERFGEDRVVEPGACAAYARAQRDKLEQRLARETGEMRDLRTMDAAAPTL